MTDTNQTKELKEVYLEELFHTLLVTIQEELDIGKGEPASVYVNEELIATFYTAEIPEGEWVN